MRGYPVSLLFVLVLEWTVGAVSAQAQDTDRARELFERGVELFAEEEYDAALDAFQQSYDINPANAVLYNIAMCQMALFRYNESIDSFDQYLQAGGDRIPGSQRREIEGYIREMESRMGELRLSIAPENAEVTLDGVPIPREQWPRLRIRTGRHVLRITARGHHEEVRQLDIATQSREDLTIELEVVPTPAGQVAVAVAEPTPIVRRWWFWTIIGAVAAGAATGLAIGLTQDQAEVGSGDWNVRLP